VDRAGSRLRNLRSATMPTHAPISTVERDRQVPQARWFRENTVERREGELRPAGASRADASQLRHWARLSVDRNGENGKRTQPAFELFPGERAGITDAGDPGEVAHAEVGRRPGLRPAGVATSECIQHSGDGLYGKAGFLPLELLRPRTETNGYRPLNEDRPGVDPLLHEVVGEACYRLALVERPSGRAESSVGGEETGVVVRRTAEGGKKLIPEDLLGAERERHIRLHLLSHESDEVRVVHVAGRRDDNRNTPRHVEPAGASERWPERRRLAEYAHRDRFEQLSTNVPKTPGSNASRVADRDELDLRSRLRRTGGSGDELEAERGVGIPEDKESHCGVGQAMLRARAICLAIAIRTRWILTKAATSRTLEG